MGESQNTQPISNLDAKSGEEDLMRVHELCVSIRNAIDDYLHKSKTRVNEGEMATPSPQAGRPRTNAKSFGEHLSATCLDPSEGIKSLQFLPDGLFRNGAKIHSQQNLAVAFVDQTLRTKMSVERFAHLRRGRTRGGYRDDAHLENAFRRQLSAAGKLIRSLGLPFKIDRIGKWVIIRVDETRLECNIRKAFVSARAAISQMWISDLEGAAALAREALVQDVDCQAAARVVARIAGRQPHLLTDYVLMHAEVCFARALVKIMETERRLLGACDTRLAKSRQALEYRKKLTLKHWRVLGDQASAGGDESLPSEGAQVVAHVRHFIRNWVLTFSGDSRAQRRLQANAIFSSVINHLIENTVKRSGLAKRKGAEADLSNDVIRVLSSTTWLPAPVFSSDELERQLIAFLARRIDRELVTGRSKQRGRTDQRIELLADRSHPATQDSTKNLIERMDVDSIVSQLPDQQRSAFVLHMEKVPLARIAKKLNIKPVDASNLLKQATQHLASLPIVQGMIDEGTQHWS